MGTTREEGIARGWNGRSGWGRGRRRAETSDFWGPPWGALGGGGAQTKAARYPRGGLLAKRQPTTLDVGTDKYIVLYSSVKLRPACAPRLGGLVLDVKLSADRKSRFSDSQSI